MKDDFTETDALLQEEYDKQLADLRRQYEAAGTRRERSRIRRRIRRLRKMRFNGQVTPW